MHPGATDEERGIGRGLWALLTAQAQVLFIDNAAKMMLVALCAALNDSPIGRPADAKNVLFALMILPLVAFAPLVSWFSDAFSKRSVLVRSLWFQLAVMGVLAAGLLTRNLWIAVVGFFLLGVQGAVFSPAKQGIVKELVGSRGLARAVSWLELLAFGAILLGSVAGSRGLVLLIERGLPPWDAAEWVTAGLAVFAVIAVAVAHRLPATPAHAPGTFRWNLLWDHGPQLAAMWRLREVRWTILGNAWFMGLGGGLNLTLIESLNIIRPGHGVDAAAIGMAVSGLGIMAGSGLVGAVTKAKHHPGLVPVGGAGLAAGLAALVFLRDAGWVLHAVLFAIGVCGAMWVVPLLTEMQDRTPPAQRGRILGANNLVVYLVSILFIALQYALREWLHLGAAAQFTVYAVMQGALTLAAFRLCLPRPSLP